MIAKGGEGKVWATNRSGCLAKIYTFFPDTEKVEKLNVMIANPLITSSLNTRNISIAWPQDLIYNNKGNCVGFLMPEIKKAKPIFEIYNSKRRRMIAPGFNWLYLHAVAQNLAAIIKIIHANGCVIGDINQKNILVNNQAEVAIIDTDSFQVTDPKSQKIFRCPVGTSEFTPPELLGKKFSILTQTKCHDRFRLAVIIYYLLFSGNHPFSGRWNRLGNQPKQEELIKQGIWLYSKNSFLQPSPSTIPLDIVHPSLKKLFLKCFNDGHKNPGIRPSAKDWLKALEIATGKLKQCNLQKNHIYSQTYGKCYWCERKANLGEDIFL